MEEGVAPQYVYYALRANRSLLLKYANGTTFPELSGGALREVAIPMPRADTQRLVVDMLDPIDDKEVHCIQLADRLMRLARALYFRSRRQAKHRVALGDLAELRGGRTPSTKALGLWSGRNFWATPKDLTSRSLPFLDATDRTLSDEGIEVWGAALAPAGSVLLATRATIGAATIVSAPMAFNQGCTAVVPRDQRMASYLFHELSSRVTYLESLASGTTFLELGKRSLREMVVSVPSVETLDSVLPQLALLHRRAESLAQEADRLAVLRDGLLRQIFGTKVA